MFITGKITIQLITYFVLWGEVTHTKVAMKKIKKSLFCKQNSKEKNSLNTATLCVFFNLDHIEKK